ncbi:MAG TPA: condensation domain-containing protein, partial [Thermoanaerobaculia bacterium]|nr:condensation domain-containing protein [Thermoanaerobaculia bacterium]
FAPPELELLGFATMGERRAAFSGRDSFWLEGLIRAVMELRGVGPEEAKSWLAEAEDADLPVPELYRRLQERLQGPDGTRRLLVDKTPSYALNPSVLERAEEVFEGARYLHLLRHPHGMIHSFEEAKLEQVFFRYPHSFGRRELAELVWLVSQRNIERFFAGVGEERKHRVRFEELVREPERVLRGICEFLGVEYHPDMADPYKERSARMTDGVYEASRMLGDVKFHGHRGVDAAAADRWRAEVSEDFLGEPTRAAAAALGYSDVAPASPWTIRAVPRESGVPLPLSYAQERLWFLDQLDPGNTTYNIPSALSFAGRLDLGALAAAIAEVVRRHSSLRTTFTVVEGRPAQVITAPAAAAEAAPESTPESSRAWGLPLADLSALPPSARDPEALRLVDEEARRKFDLARGPLLRVALLRKAAEDHVALLTMHHIVSDGWSMGLLIGEVSRLYAAHREGWREDQPSPLPALPLQYVDYAEWQRGWLQGEVLERELAHWRRALAGVPPLQLPTDRPRPAVQSFRGGDRVLRLSPEVTEGLNALAQAEQATLFTVLLAGYQALLARHAGQEDLAVGTPVANRNRAEIEGLIGFFLNTLVLRTDLSGDPAFGVLLERVRRVALAAYDHQAVPFEKVVQELAPERNLSRSPLFQVLLVLQNIQAGPRTLPGLDIAVLEREGATAKFDLSLNLMEVE